MGKHALKMRMPRVLPDHRSAEAGRLRTVYCEVMEKLSTPPAPARRIGLMCAEAWRDYEDLGIQIARAKKNKRSAVEIRRLRKERRLAAGNYLGGMRELQAMIDRDGHKPRDLARAIQRAQEAKERGTDGNG